MTRTKRITGKQAAAMWLKALGWPTIFETKFDRTRCQCGTPECPGHLARRGDRFGYLDNKLVSAACIDRIIKKRWSCPDCHDTHFVKDAEGKWVECDCPNKPQPQCEVTK
jgi:hypothetical protein